MSTNENRSIAGNLQRIASLASLTVASLLVAAKIWAWMTTASVSVLSSLVDSFLDVFASAITAVAVAIALRPADSEHRFGHGKTEGLAALAQAIIITASALYVLSEAIQRLLTPQPITQPEAGMAVMLMSISLTLGLVLFQRHVVRQTGSVAIAADAAHYRMDLLINLSVLGALPLAAWTSWTMIDPLIGIGIAAYILHSTYGIACDALDVLLDRELPIKDRQQIESIARAHPDVLGFHDLRTRSGGTHKIIQFHLELEPHTTLLVTHRILDEVEAQVRDEYPGCEIIVHPDPLGFEEERDDFAE